jgi:5-methylcytosine-specific restriction endonuclease McrA
MKGARNGGSVFLGEIIERDGLDCHLCGRPVDMDLAWPHRDSKSVDHVIPLSRGGEHVLANCALAHMGCNSSKGAKLAA